MRELAYPELRDVGNGLFKQCGTAVFATTATTLTVATNLNVIVGGVANITMTGVTANDSLSVIAGTASGTFTIERGAAGVSAGTVYYEVVGKLRTVAA